MQFIKILFFLYFTAAKHYIVSILLMNHSQVTIGKAKPLLKDRIKSFNQSNTYGFNILMYEDENKCKIKTGISHEDIANEIDKITLFHLFDAEIATNNKCVYKSQISWHTDTNAAEIYLDKFGILQNRFENNIDVEIICADKPCDTIFEYENKLLKTKTVLDLSKPVIGTVGKCGENEKYPNRMSHETIEYNCPPGTQISQPYRCSARGTWPKAQCQCPWPTLIENGYSKPFSCPLTGLGESCITACGENMKLKHSIYSEVKCDAQTLKWISRETCRCVPEPNDDVIYHACDHLAVGLQCHYSCKKQLGVLMIKEHDCTPYGWKKPPICDKVCLKLPVLEHAIFPSSCIDAEINASCKTYCEAGFRFEGEHPTCGSNREWVTGKAFCSEEFVPKEFYSFVGDCKIVTHENKMCLQSCLNMSEELHNKPICRNKDYDDGNEKCISQNYVLTTCNQRCNLNNYLKE